MISDSYTSICCPCNVSMKHIFRAFSPLVHGKRKSCSETNMEVAGQLTKVFAFFLLKALLLLGAGQAELKMTLTRLPEKLN